MSMPLPPGHIAAAFPQQWAHVEQKVDHVTQPLGKFNSRNVNKQVIYQFLSDMKYDEVRALSESMCNAAAQARGRDWNKTNLQQEFAEHGLSFDGKKHNDLNSIKCRAVLNLLLEIKNEASEIASNNGKLPSTGGSSGEIFLADRFCSLLKDAKSVFTGGKDYLFDEINRSPNVSAADTVHDQGASVHGDHGSQALSQLSPDSGSTPKLPAPREDASTISASAPPNYDAVQSENLHARINDLNLVINSMHNGLKQDYQKESFISTLNWANEEIQTIRFKFSSAQLEHFQVKAIFDQADNALRALNEQCREKCLVKTYRDQIEAFNSKVEVVEAKQQIRLRELDALIQNLEDIKEDVLKLRYVDSERKALEKDIREWKTQLQALGKIQNVAGLLEEFEYAKTSDWVENCSKHLKELDALIYLLPTSSRKNRLLKRASEHRSQFENFRQSVSKQHSASKLTDIESALQRAKAFIETSEKDKNPSESHLSEADKNLLVVRNELAYTTDEEIATKRDGLLSISSDLQTRLERLRAATTKRMEQATAVEITPPVSQVHPSYESIIRHLDDAEAKIDALAANPDCIRKEEYRIAVTGHLDQATNELVNITGQSAKPKRDELTQIIRNLREKFNNLDSKANQEITVKEREKADRILPEQPGIKQAVIAVNKGLQNYQGSLTSNSASNVLGSLADVLMNMSVDRQDNKSNHQDSATRGALFNKVAPESGHTYPPRSAIAPSTPLATLAAQLNQPQSAFYSDNYVATSIAVKCSESAIIPVHNSFEIPFSDLQKSLQLRMQAACNGQQPEMITFSQVTLIANDPQAFDQGYFNIVLNSQINRGYQRKLQYGPAGRKYSPIGVNVSLPKDLQRNAAFHRTGWSLHETKLYDDAKFAFKTDAKNAYFHDIGYLQLQKIIRAAGGSEDQASSMEAGILIPYGVQIKRQSDSILKQIEQSSSMLEVDYLSGFPALPSNVVHDSGRGVDEVDGATNSGAAFVPIEHETIHDFSRRATAKEVLVDKAGLLSIRLVSGLDKVKNIKDLEEWMTLEMIRIDLSKMVTL